MITRKHGQYERIHQHDESFDFWNERGANARFTGRPEYIDVILDVAGLTTALQQAVDEDKYVVIRSGGHCLERFVSNNDVEVIIDISNMKGVTFDSQMKAFEVMAGTTVGESCKALHDNWNVVLPLGEYPKIGVGGHIPGGAFGFLCRQYGLAVDYLCALELLWVDKNRKVSKLIATNQPDDPNREIWWAHTGGGAGNFGVVTRYWFRSPGDDRALQIEALPKAPAVIETFELEWSWKDIDEATFIKLVGNFGSWCELNADHGMESNAIFATLHLFNKRVGKILLKGVMSVQENVNLIDNFINELNDGVGVHYTSIRKKMTWLDFALHPFPDIFSDNKGAFKVKDAFMKKPFSNAQLKTAYYYLTNPSFKVAGAFMGHATYGGRVNAVDAHSTASFQRSAIMTTACSVGWAEKGDDGDALKWVRDAFEAIYQESKGVPSNNEMTGGSIINHPDADYRDEKFNRSGQPWYQLYYGDQYKRLQKVKAITDPCNIFHHVLSIEPEFVLE